MSLLNPIQNYEPFARMQNELKSTDQEIAEEIIPLLEHLILQHLPKGARILDLGCGSGKLVQQLHLRGYQTTGIDASPELLRYARIN